VVPPLREHLKRPAADLTIPLITLAGSLNAQEFDDVHGAPYASSLNWLFTECLGHTRSPRDLLRQVSGRRGMGHRQRDDIRALDYQEISAICGLQRRVTESIYIGTSGPTSTHATQ